MLEGELMYMIMHSDALCVVDVWINMHLMWVSKGSEKTPARWTKLGAQGFRCN